VYLLVSTVVTCVCGRAGYVRVLHMSPTMGRRQLPFGRWSRF